MRPAAILLLAATLAGCDRPAPQPDRSPGARLEAAAARAGLVVDGAAASPVGAWARDTDRLCVVPAGDRFRIGVSVDYGEGQACAATGDAERHGDRLRIDFGACRLDAAFDGERIVFPAELPGACDALCTGRASLTALEVERLSGSVAEATSLRTPGGRPLCGG